MKHITVTALLVWAFGMVSTLSAFAAVPEFGSVIEGKSVPGVALGSTRQQVEAAYGEPTYCQSGQTAGDAAYCTWILPNYIGQGGDVQSQVNTHYTGPNGGSANNHPNDVVSNISWYGMDGWFTTTGFNTLFALNDPDAVISAYPDAIVTDQSLFTTYLTAYEDGISIHWHTEYLNGFTSVRMSIFEPRDPPPPREPSVNVSEINMDLNKRQVLGQVRVLNDLNWRVGGARVYATWTLPDGSTQAGEGTTDSFGLVMLALNKCPQGTLHAHHRRRGGGGSPLRFGKQRFERQYIQDALAPALTSILPTGLPLVQYTWQRPVDRFPQLAAISDKWVSGHCPTP